MVTVAPLEFASKPNDPEPPNKSNAFESLRSFPNQLNKVSFTLPNVGLIFFELSNIIVFPRIFLKLFLFFP